jgi:hypothetical protein
MAIYTIDDNNIITMQSAAPANGFAGARFDSPRNRPQTDCGAPGAREGSKKAIILAMLRSEDGATLKQIMEATHWQPHTVRGFISGAIGKQLGLTVESTRTEPGERRYRILA